MTRGPSSSSPRLPPLGAARTTHALRRLLVSGRLCLRALVGEALTQDAEKALVPEDEGHHLDDALRPAAPALLALLSVWLPLIPIALLDSQIAPTITVSPEIATEVPNRSNASVLEAFRYAC